MRRSQTRKKRPDVANSFVNERRAAVDGDNVIDLDAERERRAFEKWAPWILLGVAVGFLIGATE